VFVPPHYARPDAGWDLRLVQDNPLGLLVTCGSREPLITHLPMIPDDATRSSGVLDGGLLLGHLNRTNPHARALAAGTAVVAVFHGPHAYVSPAVYGTTPAAPTWNFTAVHVHGRLLPVNDTQATLDILVATVTALESRHGEGWQHAGSIGYFRRILPGVQAFRIEVDRVDAMAKLSQDKDPETRARVARHLAAGESGSRRELAAEMVRVRKQPGG
jgi:transcriptional regulator